MRIAFLNSWTLDIAKGSGTAAAITGLVGGLNANGHAVEIIGPNERASSLLLQRILYNLELKYRVSPDDFDLIVGFDIDGFDLNVDVPYIVYLHGISADEMRFEHGAPRQYLRTLSHLERANAQRADRVIVTSEYSRSVTCEAYGLPAEKVGVVGNGIHPAHWERISKMKRSTGHTILSVARQYPRKNTKSLIQAMPRVLATVPNVKLRVVGGGPRSKSLEKQVGRLGLESAVTLLGELPEDEAVRNEYAAADVFCLPSLQEGFGIAFLEAMAAGLPVVALDVAAVPEIVGDAGVLLPPPGDEAALADALINLLKNKALREELGRCGIERAASFSWSAVAERFIREVSPCLCGAA
ncbi:MAG: glycosyltransferase family 4 protein [Nitrospinae bacterium]|nr:glycosyltransferase family 4 protein [Nitrospinota bacterium]